MAGRIVTLTEALQASVPDPEMLEQLRELALDPDRWPEAHQQFRNVRTRLLERQEDNSNFGVQCAFVELCYKSLFNETNTSAPFDSDSAFFVVPAALRLAEDLGLDTNLIVDATLSQPI